MKKWYDINELKKHKKNHYAQAGEDGLIEYIFKNITPKSKVGVEFGSGGMSGTPNLRYLVEKFQWKTIMWDGIENNFKKNGPSICKKFGIHNEIVTDENINNLFTKYEISEDVDIVVIDVDGQDYYIWESLTWKPQVVEIEFNTTLDVNESKVMHRDIEHYKWRDSKSSYYGASVTALKKLGKKKGYTLIGCCGRNLFFVLDELVEDGYDVDVNDLGVELVKADKPRLPSTKEKWVEV